MPSADLVLAVSAFGSDPLRLNVSVQNNVDDPDGLRIDAAIDGTAGAMALPTSLVPQKAALRVYVNGSVVPELTACRVTRGRDNHLQTWEFTVPIHRGATGYAGDWRGHGNGLCIKRVDIYGVYKTSTGEHEIPLITNGIADSEARESGGGAFVTYQGVDAGGRFDGEMIDLVLPPGSGLPRQRVVQIAATRAGVEDISLETSSVPMMKEFQLADSQFIDPCQEIAEVEGRMIQWTRDGYLHWPQYGSRDLVPSSSRWSLTEKHWVMGSARLSQPAELITEVTVEGDEQVLVGACGDVTTVVKIKTQTTDGPVSPAYQQSTGSVYTANPSRPAPSEAITTHLEILETTRRCGIIVYERRTLYEFFNKERTRYAWSTDDEAWVTLGIVYTNDNTDDDSLALNRSVEVWTLTEMDETFHYWFREGFEGPTAGAIPARPANLNMGWGLRAPIGWDGTTNGTGYIPANDPNHSYSPDWEGCKIGTHKKSWRFYGPRKHVRERSITTFPLTPWEEIEPENGWEVLGNKEAIVGNREAFRLFSSEIVQYGSDGRGFLTDENVTRFGWFAPKGSAYLYGDDTVRADSQESFQYIGGDETKYIGAGEQTHDEIVTRTSENQRTVETVATTGLDSYLPAIERIPDSGPTTDTDVYRDDTELSQLYRKVYRTESKPISVTVTDLDLENCSTRSVHKVRNAYIESIDEADWLARWLIDEGMAARFDGELAGANFFIEPGDWCSTVRYRQIGVNGAGRVDSVSWDWQAGEPIRTKVSILLYEVAT